MEKFDISIVVPAYNEAKRIGKTIKEIAEYFKAKEMNFEVVVADDGSNDDTVGAAERVVKEINIPITILPSRQNMGKGHALKCGFAAALGDIILFTDSDLSTPLKEFDKMLPFLKGDYEVVMGSRHLSDSKIVIKQSFLRQMFGKIFYKIIFAILIKDITDTNCGFKAYSRRAGQHLYRNLSINRWGFDTEIIYLAQKYKYKIKEVPVEWYNNSDSKVNIIKAVYDTLLEIFKIKFNDIRGKYE